MAVYILLAVAVIGLGFAYKDNYIKGTKAAALNRVISAAVFLALFAVSALRIAVGNDYWPYMFNFELIAQNRFGQVAYEPGFDAVVKAIQFLTADDQYIPIFAFFSFVTVLFFVKGIRDQSEWFVFSLFLLLANGYYYSSLNSVRYYFALALAMWSMKFIIDDRHVEFIATVLAGALFHKSILVVIPVYYLCRLKWNKIGFAIVTLFSASLPICKNFYRKIIFIFYPFYEGSLFDNFEISYTNILKSAAIVAFCLIFYKSGIKESKKNRFYFNLNIASFLVYTCCSFMPEYTRIGYYFAISHIFLVPSVLKSIVNKKIRRIFTAVIIVCFTAYFGLFLRTCYDINIRLLPYLDWVFHG